MPPGGACGSSIPSASATDIERPAIETSGTSSFADLASRYSTASTSSPIQRRFTPEACALRPAPYKTATRRADKTPPPARARSISYPNDVVAPPLVSTTIASMTPSGDRVRATSSREGPKQARGRIRTTPQRNRNLVASPQSCRSNDHAFSGGAQAPSTGRPARPGGRPPTSGCARRSTAITTY
jgi:hypothetical protein